MLKSLQIKNFRGISRLTLEDLGQLNILVGKNNCGKTTILESIFLLIGASNAVLPKKINELRGYLGIDSYSWSLIFPNLDFESKIEIEGSWEKPKEHRRLYIKPFNSVNEIEIARNIATNSSLMQKNVDNSTEVSSQIDGLSLEFYRSTISKKKNSVKQYSTHIFIRDGQVYIEKPKTYRESIIGVLYNSQFNFFDLATRFDQAQINKNTDKIIMILKEIEPNLVNLISDKNGVVYCDIGLKKYLPVNVMGDGLLKVLSLILAIQEVKNGIALIDEFENGLHYKVQKILWKAVIQAASVFNVQLFITTHSLECIRALMSEGESPDNNTSKIRLYRIEKEDRQYFVERYLSNSLKIALSENWEIR
jgi:AAA15 family ATPase/GTPase